MKDLYNQVVLGIIAVSLSVLAIINSDIVGSANAVVNTYPMAKAGEPMIGEIRLFAGDFAPEGWAICNGAAMEIKYHKDLFTIIGDVYGGDEKEETFNLPDLRGRVAVGLGKDGLVYETELATKRDYASEILNDSRQFANKRNSKVSSMTKSKTNTLSVQSSPVNENSTRKIRTGDLGLNYIICVDGVMPE